MKKTIISTLIFALISIVFVQCSFPTFTYNLPCNAAIAPKEVRKLEGIYRNQEHLDTCTTNHFAQDRTLNFFWINLKPFWETNILDKSPLFQIKILNRKRIEFTLLSASRQVLTKKTLPYITENGEVICMDNDYSDGAFPLFFRFQHCFLHLGLDATGDLAVRCEGSTSGFAFIMGAGGEQEEHYKFLKITN